MNFDTITDFEKQIAKFFGAPYAIAVDSCTHGVELALRYTNADYIRVPNHTYLSIPFLANKLNIDLFWKDEQWVNYYYLQIKLLMLLSFGKRIAIFQTHLWELVFNSKNTYH